MGVWTNNYTKLKRLQEDVQFNSAFYTINGASVTLGPTKFETLTTYKGNDFTYHNYVSTYNLPGTGITYPAVGASYTDNIRYRCWMPYFANGKSAFNDLVHNDGNNWLYCQNMIVVGSGTTAPTVNDIDLEHRLPWTTSTSTSLQLGLFYSCSYTSPNKCICKFTNVGYDSITVSEVGIYSTLASTSSTTALWQDGILIYRDTFTPITLQHGDFIQFVINFSGYREG